MKVERYLPNLGGRIPFSSFAKDTYVIIINEIEIIKLVDTHLGLVI